MLTRHFRFNILYKSSIVPFTPLFILHLHLSSLKHICFGLQKTVFYPPKDRLSSPESLSFAG